MDSRNARLIDLAERQHGLVARAQAADLDLGWDELRERMRAGGWEPYGRRLLRRRGSPPTKAQRVLGAVLDAGPGAVLSHGSAAAWWGLPGFDLRALHVTRPRGASCAPARFATLHTVVDLRPEHVTVLDGVPIVRPERCFIEICARAHPARAERMFDNAWSRRLLSGDSARRVLDELARSGRNGIVLARQILDDRGPGYVPPASSLEARVAELLGPGWRRQVDAGGERWSGRVDFRHDRLPVVVEVQSERYHASLCDRTADAARKAKLEADGFTVVEVWDVDVWRHPETLTEQVLASRSRAMARKRDAKTGWRQAS